jgi:transposase-like protein
MNGRVCLGEEFWRDAVARQAASGLSVAAFCRDQKLVPVTFYKWRKQLRGSPGVASPEDVSASRDMNAAPSARFVRRRRATAGQPGQPGLVELILTPRRGSDEEEATAAAVVEVSLTGGMFVRFHGGVSSAAIAATIEAIRRANQPLANGALSAARSRGGVGQ